MTHDDDWLVRALRAHEPRLDDDGFTQRVMAALPPVRAAGRPRADWIVLLGAAAGSAVAATQFPLASLLAPWLELAPALLHDAQLVLAGGVVMLAGTALALLAGPLRRAL